MYRTTSQDVFFELLRAGLWEKDALLAQFDAFDYSEVYKLAQEQSVVGLIAAGLEHVVDVKVPKDIALLFAGEALQLEQRNQAMNQFIVETLDKLNEAGIDSVLIKGQGVAQCYERPLWRSSGDVDLLLNDDNFERGKSFISKITDTKVKEISFNKEYNTTIGGWSFELHGSLRSGLSTPFNKGVDEIQHDICDNHQVRYWILEGSSIPLPEENNDVLVVFTHFIKHFYKGGLGVRQICDWCRLLWVFRKTIDASKLEQRLRTLCLMTEWRAFAAFAVDYLGMPVDAIPYYGSEPKWSRKADKISSFVLDVGNFGHNMDESYYSKYPFLIRKTISMWRRIWALIHHTTIFPSKSFRYLPHVVFTGIKSAVTGG